MIRNAPPRWKDDKISNGDAWPSGFGRQDGKNGRILKERASECTYQLVVLSDILCPWVEHLLKSWFYMEFFGSSPRCGYLGYE